MPHCFAFMRACLHRVTQLTCHAAQQAPDQCITSSICALPCPGQFGQPARICAGWRSGRPYPLNTSSSSGARCRQVPLDRSTCRLQGDQPGAVRGAKGARGGGAVTRRAGSIHLCAQNTDVGMLLICPLAWATPPHTAATALGLPPPNCGLRTTLLHRTYAVQKLSCIRCMKLSKNRKFISRSWCDVHVAPALQLGDNRAGAPSCRCRLWLTGCAGMPARG